MLQGIGYGVAEALVENGAIVTISSSNPDRVQQTIEKLKKAYPSASDRVAGQACNLGDQATLESNVAGLFEKVGKLDHVVYTAGDALAMMGLQDVTMEKMLKAGMVRFFAPLMVGKYAAKYLTGGRNSSLTLTTGSVSERPRENWSAVASYATGLHGMMRGLALDLKPLRVNLISPGAVDTELWATAGLSEEQKVSSFKEMEKKMPTGKVAEPSDIAEAYLYAMKDYNLTGSVISSNGGHLLV